MDGVRKRKNVYGKTKTECREKLRKAIAERDGGIFVDSKSLTVEQFMTRWLEDSVRGSVKIATYDDYEKTTRRYIIPEIGHVRISKLTSDMIQSLYARRLRGGLSPNTVLHIHRTLRRALNQAARWRLIPRNPVEDTDPPRKTKPRLTVLTVEEIARFIGSSADRRLFPLYMLAALSGLRAGEILGLRWSDVSESASGRPILRVERTLVNSSMGVELQDGTKSGGTRIVELTELAVQILHIHRGRQHTERVHAGSGWEDRNLVFTSKTGRYIHPANVSQYLRRDLAKAGLPEVRFHDLRHSFATVLAGAGAHAAIVAGMLGHADANLTLSTYTHYLPSMQGWATERLDEIFPASMLAANGHTPPETHKNAPEKREF